MYRAWASLNAHRVGAPPPTWQPLASVLSILQYQHRRAEQAAVYWKSQYVRFLALPRQILSLRARASMRAMQAAHHKIPWRPILPTLTGRLSEYQSAYKARLYWFNRWVLHLRTQARLTPSEVVLVIDSYPWPDATARYIAWRESRYRYWLCNAYSPEHCGIFQESYAIRSRWGIGDGLAAGPNIDAAYKQYVYMHHSFVDWGM